MKPEEGQAQRPTLGRRTALALYWNFLGRMGMMAGRWVESLLIVWLLGAEKFGMFESARNLMAFALPFTAFGLEAAVSRFLPQVENSGKDSKPLLKRVIAFRVAVCGAVMVGMILFAKPLAEAQLKDSANWILVVLAAGIVLVYGVRNMQFRVLVARFEQRFLNGIQVGEIFAYLGLATLLILLGISVAGALFAMLLAGIAAILFSAWRIRATQPIGAEKAKEPVSIRRMIVFSGSFYGYNLLNTVLEKPLDILLLSHMHPDFKQVAYYTVAYTLALFAVSISGKALAEGITLTIVSEARETGDKERLRKIYGLLTEYLFILTFPAVAGLLALGGELLSFMYGGRVDGAWIPLLVFLPVMAYGKFGGLTANFLAGMDKERWLVIGRLVFGVVNLVLDVLWIPKYGALGAVYATSTATIIGTTFELGLVHWVLKPRYPWAYFAKMALIGCGVFGAAWSIKLYLPGPIWVRLGVAVAAGVIVYLAGLAILKPVSRENIKLAGTLRIPARGVFRYFLPK
jgi:O-antigen/teichoic acid export membrane protein